MPKRPDSIRKPALLAGAATLLVATGCAQDDREYAPVPADSDYAWYVPDEVPGWSPSEPSDNSQIFVSSGCTITLSLYEDQTARFISEEEAAKYWMEMVAMQIGGDAEDAPVTVIDPIELSTDTGETTELTTVEVLDEAQDAGARVGVHWQGEDELNFVFKCGQPFGSWSEGEGELDAFFEDIRVTLP